MSTLSCHTRCARLPADKRVFTYSALTEPYPTDTIPFSLLRGGIDQLVIDGTIPAPNTVVYMPPHTALLALFSHPRPDDQIALDVSNPGLNSVDLTIYKANTAPTGSPDVVYTQPIRIATIPASSVVRLYLRVIDATPVTGVADVKMLASLEGGTGSVPTPVITIDMSDGSAALLAQQIVQSTVGQSFQLMFTNGLAPSGVVRLPVVPQPASGPAQMLYANCDTSGPPLVSPLLAGDSFDFVLTSTNASGYNLAWSTGGVAGVQLTGSATQPTGTTYQVTFRFLMAGTAPAFLGSTLTVDLANVCTSRVGELVLGLSSPTPAADFLKCDGSAVLQTSYPSLYSKVGLLPKFTTGVQSAMQFGQRLMAYSPTLGLYVAADSSASHSKYLVSPDGLNWKRAQSVFTNGTSGTPPVAHLIWSTLLGQFIACDHSTALYVSSDGYNFRAVETYTGAQFKHIADSGTVLCAYGIQPLVPQPLSGTALNAVWMTADPTLQAWTRVPLTTANTDQASSNDMYYAAAQNVFCLSLSAPVTPFSISNTVPPGAVTVTAGVAVTSGTSIVQFASDARAIYAVSTTGVYFSTNTMAAWTQTLNSNAGSAVFTGVAVNPNATGTDAQLVAAATGVGIATSQTQVLAGTTMLTHCLSTAPSQTTEQVSYNPALPASFRYVRAYNRSGGALAMSPDLSTWYNPDTTLSAVTATFNCTAANPAGRTVVAGSAAVAYSTANGTTWTVSSGLAGTILHMIWSTRLSRFVAVSSSASFSSADGVTFSSGDATTPPLANTIAIADGTAGCVTVTSNATSGNNYAVWNDVGTWTPLQLNCGDVINGIACNGSVYCIVTLQSNVWTTSTPATATSWVRQQGWMRCTLFNCVAAVGTRFVLYGIGGTTAAVSTDGGVTVAAVGIPQPIQTINYANGRAICVGPSGNYCSSTDASAWVCDKLPINPVTSRVFFLNGLYFVGSDRGTMVSPDGQNWSLPNSNNMLTVTGTGLGFGGKVLAAGGVTFGTSALYTTDAGATWTAPKSFGEVLWNELAYAPALNLAACALGGGALVTTPDGTTWTSRAAAQSYLGMNGATYDYTTLVWAAGPGLFVGGASAHGRVVTSSDGIAWTERPTGAEARIRQICYNETLALFCAVGDEGYIGTSPNGVAWTTRTGPFRSVNLTGVATLEAAGFVAFAATNAMLRSPTGISWTATVVPVAFAAVKVYYSATFGGVFIPAGNAAVDLFTNDGQTVTLGQGVSSAAAVNNVVRYDPYTDAMLAGSSTATLQGGGCFVMPRAYDRATQFVLPTLADTWARAA